MFSELLKRKKVKQKDLASKLLLSQSAVNLWCKGKCLPTLNLIPKIAKFLNCTMEEVVLSLVDVQENENSKERNFHFEGQEKMREVV